ncbi:hypothetical protein V8C44DRAFT_339683 [Trichoderma aethiopicum]
MYVSEPQLHPPCISHLQPLALTLSALPRKFSISQPWPPHHAIPSDVSIRPAARVISRIQAQLGQAPFCNMLPSPPSPLENRGRKRASMTEAGRVVLNLDKARNAGLGFTLLLTGWTVTRGLAYPQDAASISCPERHKLYPPPSACGFCLFCFFLPCPRETIPTGGKIKNWRPVKADEEKYIPMLQFNS